MKLKVFSTLFIAAMLIACAPTTKVQKTWSDPSLTKERVDNYKKILVLAPLKDESGRRIAEDKLKEAFKNREVIQSYTYLSAADTSQKAIEAKLLANGFDAVLVMQLKEIEKSVSYTPGTSYYGGGYYGRGYYGYGGGYYSPGYYSEDKTFVVETNIYDVKENKLVWSTTTTTVNPTALEKSLDGIIYSVRYEMMKKGLIKY